MSKPLVSVVIPVYNGERFIAQAIESILKQTFQDWELIIVNDGSTDAGEKVIKKYLGDRRIHYFAHARNLGVASASNTGLAKASGKYITIQDCDDISLPERFEIEIGILESNKKCNFVFSTVLFMDNYGNILSQWGGGRLKEGLYSPWQIFYKLYIEGDFIPNGSVMMRNLGKTFDTKFKICNDYERYLEICHEHFVYFYAKPLLKMRRGERHNSLSSDKESLFAEERFLLKDIYRRFSKISILPVRHQHYSEAMSNQLFKEARYYFKKGAQLRAKLRIIQGLLINPFKNGYMLESILPRPIFTFLQRIKRYIFVPKSLAQPKSKMGMRIAYIVEIFPTLSETFILNQITGLIDLGHDVEIFAKIKGKQQRVHPDIEKYNLLAKMHIIDNEIPRNKIKRLCKAFWLITKGIFKNPIAIVKSMNFFKYGKEALNLRILFFTSYFIDKDIIHCHFGPNALRHLFLKDILNVRFITSFHGYDATSYVKKYGTTIYRSLFKKCDLFTVNSSHIQQQLYNLGCQKHKITRLPMGLDLDKYNFKARSLRKKEQIRILTIARLVEKKGLEYSIRAVAKLIPKYRNIEYRIVGDGLLRNKLEDLILKLKTDGNIKLLGWKDSAEVMDLLNQSHIFVLSSITTKDGDQEGQGVVLQEAQSVGMPIVATRHNGFSESLINSKTGFLVPERAINALAERVEYLILHPEIWPEMGNAGRRFVENNFDIKKLNKRLVEIYTDGKQK